MCKTVKEKMKIYAPPEPPEELPIAPQTPTRFRHAEDGLRQWQEKVNVAGIFSSPPQRAFDSHCRGTQTLLSYGEVAVSWCSCSSTRER
jgi:hypothetical protein